MSKLFLKPEKAPNFFIVGAPKAGTTSLYFYLKTHPEIFMPEVKETNFFSYPFIEEQNLYYKERGIGNSFEYQKLFENVSGEKAIGEASVSYLAYPKVASILKENFPDSRIVIMLRNPLSRAFSHYQMDYRMGYIKTSIREIVFKERNTGLAQLQYQQVVSLGLYFNQVKNYYDFFGKEKVHVILYDEFAKNTEQVVRELFSFLKVNSKIEIQLDKKHNISEMPRNKILMALFRVKAIRQIIRGVTSEKMRMKIKKILMVRKSAIDDERVVSKLKSIYHPDIAELEKLIGRDLSAWYE